MKPLLVVAGAGFVGAQLLRAAPEFFSGKIGIVRTAKTPPTLSAGIPASGGEVLIEPCDVCSEEERLSFARRHGFLHSEAAPPVHLVFAVSASGQGPQAFRALFVDALSAILAEWRPSRVILVSSTSVYGQTDGSWVSEQSATEPASENSRTLLEAEGLVRNVGGVVARFSGLYGPGRCVYVRKLLDGTATIDGDGSRWINQLHRDDAASALCCLLRSGVNGEVYNVSDNMPRTLINLYDMLARHYARPLPPAGHAPDPKRRRGLTSKRVSNAKLRALGWTPRYPAIEDALPIPL